MMIGLSSVERATKSMPASEQRWTTQRRGPDIGVRGVGGRTSVEQQTTSIRFRTDNK